MALDPLNATIAVDPDFPSLRKCENFRALYRQPGIQWRSAWKQVLATHKDNPLPADILAKAAAVVEDKVLVDDFAHRYEGVEDDEWPKIKATHTTLRKNVVQALSKAHSLGKLEGLFAARFSEGAPGQGSIAYEFSERIGNVFVTVVKFKLLEEIFSSALQEGNLAARMPWLEELAGEKPERSR